MPSCTRTCRCSRGATPCVTRCCCSAARTRTCRSCGVLAHAHPRDLGEPRLRLSEGRAHRGAGLHARQRQYYAAFGAVVYGVTDEAAARRRPLRGARRPARLHGERSPGPARGVRGPAPGRDTGRARGVHRRVPEFPTFDAATFEPGQVVQGVIGLDGGSTSARRCSSTTTLGEVLYKAYTCRRATPSRTPRRSWARSGTTCSRSGPPWRCKGFGATGYAADVLEESVRADVNIVETIAHMQSAVRYVPDADVVCDIGGQDIKVLFLREARGAGATSGTSACRTSARRATACSCRPWPISSASTFTSTPTPPSRRGWRRSSATAARCSSMPTA